MALLDSILQLNTWSVLRTSSSLPKALGGIRDRDLLAIKDLTTGSDRGLFVIGSHVHKSTRQLAELVNNDIPTDFRESVLANTASDLWQAGDWDAAFALAHLNLEFFPESGSTYTLLGQAYAETGERDKAIQHLEKALELNPRNQAARRLLTSLTGGGR